jgi:hypothetical protein
VSWDYIDGITNFRHQASAFKTVSWDYIYGITNFGEAIYAVLKVSGNS